MSQAPPSHVHGLHADLTDTAADDLTDFSGVDAGALEQPLLHLAEQLDGVDARKPPLAPTNGGTDGFDDDDVGIGHVR